MRRKSISDVVAGGLITSATVMGVEAIVQPAEASPIVSTQTADFDFLFADNALTCCYDITGQQQFVFEGFDPTLGDLLTAELGITIDGLASQALTCCYDINDVMSFGGIFGDMDLTQEFVRDLADGKASVVLDINKIGVDLNTATLDFNILFGDGSVFPVGDTKGTVAYSYTYEPATTPSPATAALLAPFLIGPFAAEALRRRRRKDR